MAFNSIITAAQALTGKRLDPYRGYNFLVEIDGLISGGFSQAHGLEATIEVEARPEGGVNGYVRQALKGATFPNLVLSKGVTDLATLWTWFDQTRQGVIQRKNVTLMLLDDRLFPAMWWDFSAAIPVRWAGPSFDASQSSTVAVETLELSHMGFSRPLASGVASAVRGVMSLV